MKIGNKETTLTSSQRRILTLLFKFRFVSAASLAQAMNIKRESVYLTLELLITKELVVKVYEPTFRIDRKPAYYYLSKNGVTLVRRLLDTRESVVHALYKNSEVGNEFIQHHLTLTSIYSMLRSTEQNTVDVFTRTEIARFDDADAFPKNRPDFYVRSISKRQAFVVLCDNTPRFVIRKRFHELLTHSEEEGWYADYPHICLILSDERAKVSFLTQARRTLDDMGYEDDGELIVLATSLVELRQNPAAAWSSPFAPKRRTSLF